MLRHLSVKNYALISELEIDFNAGFSVITGETGSGKSIMLGALGLILGERADIKTLKSTESKCIIEGTFNLNQEVFKPLFEQYDLDYEEPSYIRREITPSGKSRAFINDTPVTLNILKELGANIIDIHSQHQTLLLNKSDFQFNVLDAGCGTKKEKGAYLKAYSAYLSVKKELEQLKEDEAKANSEKDYLEFQLKDLNVLPLEDMDTAELEQELNLLENAEEVTRVATEVSEVIQGEHRSIVGDLISAEQMLQKLQGVDPLFVSLSERLNSVIIELRDIEGEVSNKLSSIEMDEGRLNELHELFAEIQRLERKHNVLGAEELIALKKEMQEKLDSVSSLEADIERLNGELITSKNEVIKQGEKLSVKRQKGIPKLEKSILNHLAKMAMPNAEVKIELTKQEEPGKHGLESIEFLVKTNKGSQFEPLKKVASGGELSRIMLAIKVILSSGDELGTIIFDEIDTGVGGEVANNMGDIMKELASETQVISITHLPQIAGKGKNHYKVYKEIKGDQTYTKILTLEKEDRLVEIAKMLSGENPSEAAMNNAKELLN